jgi:hypothetical protein
VLIGKKEQYSALITGEYRRTKSLNEKTPGGKVKGCKVRVAAAAAATAAALM